MGGRVLNGVIFYCLNLDSGLPCSLETSDINEGPCLHGHQELASDTIIDTLSLSLSLYRSPPSAIELPSIFSSIHYRTL
jgi:hypothetical protein